MVDDAVDPTRGAPTDPAGAAIGDLSGTVALVTGGTRGIGLGLAHGLAAAGAEVCVWGRDVTRAREAARALAHHGRRTEAVVCDVADEDAVVASFAETLEHFGRVDTCFANAGLGATFAPFTDLDLDTWRRTMAVNLEGAAATLREAARHMIERGEGGSLVAVSSVSAIHGAPLNHAYAASKAALLALVRSLAVELARHRIRVNSIVPGWTDTDLLAAGRTNQRFVEATVARTPVRRWGVPADLAPAAVYLAGREPRFHTGDELVIDGGYTRF